MNCASVDQERNSKDVICKSIIPELIESKNETYKYLNKEKYYFGELLIPLHLAYNVVKYLYLIDSEEK